MESEDQLSGFPSSLTNQQKEELAGLKEKIKDSKYQEKIESHPDGDEFLLRVLRATMKDKKNKRVFQRDPAFERACSIVDFKEKYAVHEQPKSFEEFRRVYPRFAYKDPKADKLVLITRMGIFASNGRFSNFTEEEWSKNVGYEMETCEEAMREIKQERGAEIRGYHVISDLKGVGLSAISRKKATVFLAGISGENYPEMLDKVYLVNAPWVFGKVFKIIKPLLDPDTVAKFVINTGIPQELRNTLDTSLLPKEFGGENERIVPYPKDCKQYKEELISYDVDIDWKLPRVGAGV